MSTLQHTSLAEVEQIYTRLQRTFKDGTTRPIAYRRKQLLQLARMFQENAAAIEQAEYTDLGKPKQEVAIAETSGVIESALFAAEHLEEWSRPEKVQVEEWRSSWDTTVYKTPKGVALIISPWNYPFILTFNPLVGAIAAGCPTVLKPSEVVPTCAALIASLVPKYLDSEAYAVVNGAVTETTALLDKPWGHIFFTGGGKIGKIIATKAAQTLTPVTLELGGKSPVVIDEDCDLQLAARRILYGKTQNSGQLCVSPDHVYVPRHLVADFKEAVKVAYSTFFPSETALHPNSHWGNIVNPSHHSRVKGLLDRTLGEILVGGQVDGAKRIAPTVVTGVKPDDSLMEEEIFGPILPILEVENLDETIKLISNGSSPLVIYAFTNNEETKEKLLNRTTSGSLVFNDTTIQLAVHEMPFGGHGESGYGAYYDKNSFDTFTHKRSSINVPAAAEAMFGARYRPYSEEKYALMTQSIHSKIPEE
ncbi:hypothetical protein EIP91_008822 [Steccherinum ochraceum]|uniref:Aldehyde dehydrogenase n=1 Tax=Steccherinum ochraceum TaxID=92696 RepID=A0A4R0RC70_9APHY|nr:hypothetical protein EIP91_008822 [Steccherinum ochraceum]